ncbi:MAG: hypothetical protein IJH84_26910 [Saccharopolyspora sp.]|uniref:hypothetical protein n=1 Tax=Saccharopolyspora TaxID=1835 RepID=UPI001909F941|nr:MULTISPECIES: hypothetical protein [unclassified Saccharopolyspora]MBK0869008.1 hypothetical protein [Saccharopolyspora sp. HNM0986]MBQ6644632.1 hypothetical protein [Saccharopolyspora sp.]
MTPSGPYEGEVLHLWLTGQIVQLLDQAGGDPDQACAGFDELVARWGPTPMARALSEATRLYDDTVAPSRR